MAQGIPTAVTNRINSTTTGREMCFAIINASSTACEFGNVCFIWISEPWIGSGTSGPGHQICSARIPRKMAAATFDALKHLLPQQSSIPSDSSRSPPARSCKASLSHLPHHFAFSISSRAVGMVHL